ncbi:Uncharacterized protein PODLI_1B039873 [Podarcis lilfordi]|uniref:FIP-RBD domain-containing protein n=1 Tax=Podarcis lilfordi TaxID=74358 RepID=A0AA35QQL0_9SAUR|nr:Uncharacterized protein PODLI_1B039873 [Podarcis lilfordi]
MVEWEPTLMASLIGQLCILSCIQLRSRLFGRICLGSCGAFQGVRRWYKLRSKPGKKEKEREPSTNEGHRRGHTSDKSGTADLRITKASLNPFDENISAEEKPEKNSASVKPSQTKRVKPRWYKLHFKPTTLSVIPEVGSDDEQLSDYSQGTEKIAVSGDLSRSGDGSSELRSSIEGGELTANKKGTGERQTVSLLMKTSAPDDGFELNKPLVAPSALALENASRDVKGLEQKNADSAKENRQEPTKKATAEGLGTKVDPSGKKKLLQAWVSPPETHPNQNLQSDGTYPAKLRLHPVKPTHTTTSKSSAKNQSITSKILDNQNEADIKKYDPSDPAYAYGQLTHSELIQLVLKQKDVIAKRDQQVRELEDYIDNLLVRVMEETPNILRAQAHVNKKAGKM